MKDSYKKSDAVLLDRHGKVIHELRVDLKGRRLDWVKIKDISPALIKTVIHSEDRRFYEHHGVDWKAAGSSVIKNLFNKTPRGASTITMQLASILDKKLRAKNSKRTLYQKWNQITAAKEIEKTWTKEEIFEAYLNLITFKGELQGISSASRGLFDKEPNGIDETESLLLASLTRSPNASVESVMKKACILGSSLKAGVKCEDINALAQKTLAGVYSIRQRVAIAPHVAYKLLLKSHYPPFNSPIDKGGHRGVVVSTLDSALQRFAFETLKQHLMAVKRQNVNNGAVLIVNNKTGDILAYVGGLGEESGARYVDGIKAKRQAGSTLKPFLYAIAFEKQILTPASILSDSPLDVPTALGIYKPENYENDFKGFVSARTALASSLNIPAVKTLSLIGVEAFIQKLKLLGFNQLLSDDFYGLSIALGSADVSLYELVNAYRTLANKGVWSGLRFKFEKQKKEHRRAFSDEAAFLVSNILSDREARSATFNLENPLSTKFWSAVKTGTSKDMQDNWCIGYSQKYTVGVWVGNFSGEPMWNVSGVTGAAPIWLEVMNYLHKNDHGAFQKAPERIVTQKIKFENNIEPDRIEWFIKGTEPMDSIADSSHVILKNRNVSIPRIIYPVDGTIIAVDPDIPEDRQLIFFEAEGVNNNFEWLLNKEKVGDSGSAVSWCPQKGRYRLSLVDKRKGVIDSITFEVKGAVY
ncbi:MAG: penicillin-binding protein 1C [Nitrospirae bacterium]|nr:penicillin-binding protein 1C [Nitrospirota bacterium]